MTAILACAHAFSRNPKFQPEMLYLATFIIDMTIANNLSELF